MGSATWLMAVSARQGWSFVRWTMVFSPGMSEARTMVYSDQLISGAKVMERIVPRAMVERMVAPCHMAGKVRSSMYSAAPRTLARPSLRSGEVPRIDLVSDIGQTPAGFGVSDEDSTNGAAGAMWWHGYRAGCGGSNRIRLLMMKNDATKLKQMNTPRQVLFASMIGTTVEFFDFYIYATAAVLVFPKLFFPSSDPTSSTLASLATFGIAFLARPVGSALFGHFGDRIGRKKTLVVALGTMGVSTFAIGVLPAYQAIGIAAPLLLALCRFGQGIGLGGEWGGAVLLAVENAPAKKRALYGMFPQFGAPLGFLLSGGTFLLLSRWLTDKQFFSFGWRLPFLASAVLVLLGLYVRLAITETPVFEAALQRAEQVRSPMVTVLTRHARALVAGILMCLTTFVIFYLMTVFALSWGTTALHYSRSTFLMIQLVGILFFAATIPVSAFLAERGRRSVMLVVTALIGVFGMVMGPLFGAGMAGVMTMMLVGMSLIGLTYGPIGTVVSELFPTSVRYTGASLAFSMAGILGASVAPYIATWLAKKYGLQYVGYYLTGSAVLTFFGFLMTRETKDQDLTETVF
jgi:metabolite-proton symporter